MDAEGRATQDAKAPHQFKHRVRNDLLLDAKTQGINIGLGNKFFEDMGLISLRDRWVEIHYG